MKNIAILGSTGSIGENTLAIARAHPGRFQVKALAAKKNVQRLLEQALEFRPEAVCLYDGKPAFELSQKLKGSGIRVLSGDEGLAELSTLASVEQVIFALVGAIGLSAILQALKAGKSVAVANKEPLVVAGRLLMEESRRHKVPLLPIDSEHSGLWQCLEGASMDSVKKLVLTSSGGPFRKWDGPFSEVTSGQALNHPKWKMGPKITIDSATLMNKGLEVIEAVNLFGVRAEKIEVLIHPEAVIHAIVEFIDGSCLAQMGVTDMRLPIQYALTYPDRLGSLPSLDLVKVSSLHFE
ncbi:MAG TPA: 1-deoxy-D-xylulose-5-phosphate reductoisomerase, partial [bacterium]|nr:1-deoxy-D-xylulose-5-phosphate reductoisomerase [bacterium]